MSRIRSTATPFGTNSECRRRRRRRRFSGPSHDPQPKYYSHHSSGTSPHASSGTATAAAMMVVLAVTLLGATVPRAVSAGWIDPDTPQEAMTTLSLVDNSEYELVSRVESCDLATYFLFLKVEECQMLYANKSSESECLLLSTSLLSFTYLVCALN